MQWVCMTPCTFRQKSWAEGEIIETFGVEEWDYSGGFWHEKGRTEITDRSSQLIPRHFQPVNLSRVDKDCLLASRMKLPTDDPKYIQAKWKIKGESLAEKLDEELMVAAERERDAEEAPKPVKGRGRKSAGIEEFT